MLRKDTECDKDVRPTGDDGIEQGSWTWVLGSFLQACWTWLLGQLSVCSSGRAPRCYRRVRRFDRSLDSSGAAGDEKKRYMTKQRKELISRMKRVPLRKVQESLGSKMGSKGAETKASYASSAENYLVFAEEAGFPPYPLHEEDVLNFIAYALYPDPIWDSIRGIVTAIRSISSDKGYGNLESDEVDDAVAAYEHDAPESEQAYPFSKSLLLSMGANARGTVQEDAALIAAGSFCVLGRCESFGLMGPDSISFGKTLAGSEVVQVKLTNLKGHPPDFALDFSIEQLPDAESFVVGRLTLRLCPVSIFRQIKGRMGAKGGLLGSMASGARGLSAYSAKLHTAFDGMLKRSGVDNKIPGRKRRKFTSHSSRVGGACVLLKSGTPEASVANLAHWASHEMVSRYARRLVFSPNCVDHWRWCNAGAGLYR